MLASANVWAQDWTAAEAAYRELLNRFGEHPNRASFETALVVLYLQRSRFTDAFEIASRWNVEATDALGAYALAWLHFVKGESEAARQAMLRAAASWEEGGRRALGRDLVIVLARTGTDVETATSAVAAFAADKPERRLRLLDKLSTQYQRAGRFLEASQVLESLATATGEIAPTKQRYVDLSLRQAEFQILLGKPVESATLVVQAHKALASCSPCPEALRERVDARISQIAIFFHHTYHDSLDAQFYDAAETLYSYLMTVPGADADARRGNLANLKDTRDRANPASGKHNAEVLYRLAVARSETVRACYESVLLGDRTLDGSLILRMEIDHAGEVTGAATEPAAGLTGLPQVAGCVLEHVREWRFPSRTVPGTTTMRIPFVLRRAPATGT
jgi:hypothetical protein